MLVFTGCMNTIYDHSYYPYHVEEIYSLDSLNYGTALVDIFVEKKSCRKKNVRSDIEFRFKNIYGDRYLAPDSSISMLSDALDETNDAFLKAQMANKKYDYFLSHSVKIKRSLSRITYVSLSIAFCAVSFGWLCEPGSNWELVIESRFYDLHTNTLLANKKNSITLDAPCEYYAHLSSELGYTIREIHNSLN